jgi:hypothetical protein
LKNVVCHKNLSGLRRSSRALSSPHHRAKLWLKGGGHGRKKLHASQAGFAKLVGEGEGAVQSWEQGVRNASGPAVKIIRLLEDMPQLKKS